MLACGEVLSGRYRILSHIGEGGMSHVFLARDERIGKLWAVKQAKVPCSTAQRETISSCFLVEAQLMRSLDHMAFPRIVDIVRRSDGICVVMDYIEGHALSSIVREHGPQSVERVVSWGVQLCDALGYLHALVPPVIYRDMKPSNVMVQSDGRVRLVDLGAAVRSHASGEAAGCLGTQGYAAPEQFERGGCVDERTDVFGLGMTLAATLLDDASQEARGGGSRAGGDMPVPQGLMRVISIATDPDPRARYQNCAEMMDALINHAALDELHRRAVRRRLACFVAPSLAAVFLLVAGFVLTVWATWRIESSYDELLSRAEATTDEGERMACYEQAISDEPSRIEGYLGLVDLFGSDETFTLDEERVWQCSAVPTVTCIMRDSRYGELCYQVGRLYWYCYDFGSGSEVRWRCALPWFEQAAAEERFEQRGTAQTYSDAARAALSLDELVRQGEESADDYRSYYLQVVSLVHLAEAERTRLGQVTGLQIALRMLFERHAGIVDAGVRPDDIEQLVDEAMAHLRSTDMSNSRVRDVCVETLQGEGALRSALAADRAELARRSVQASSGSD